MIIRTTECMRGQAPELKQRTVNSSCYCKYIVIVYTFFTVIQFDVNSSDEYVQGVRLNAW